MSPAAHRSRNRASLLTMLGFAVAGVLLLVTRIPLWIRLLVVGLAVGALLGQARRVSMAHGLEVDGEGVRELRGGRLVGSVRWSELIAVSIIATVDGPWAPEFSYVLQAAAGEQLVIPLDRAAATGLLTRLGRLPGFDHEAVLRATSATTGAEFVCWEGELGDGGAAGGELG
jgi:hypothetical protein